MTIAKGMRCILDTTHHTVPPRVSEGEEAVIDETEGDDVKLRFEKDVCHLSPWVPSSCITVVE